MKKMIAMILAAGAMSGFAAPTANEDFVVAEDAKTYTNAVQAAKTYTDQATNGLLRTGDVPAWAKSPTPPQTITTNDVCNIVTNEVDGWEFTGLPSGAIVEPGYPSWAVGIGWQLLFTHGGVLYFGTTKSYPENATAVTINCIPQSGQQMYSVSMVLRRGNSLGLVSVALLSSASTASSNYTDTAVATAARPATRIVTEDGTRFTDATGCVFAVSFGVGRFVVTNLFQMAPGVEFVYTNINPIAWALVGGSPAFQQTAKFVAYDATMKRWIALPTSWENSLTPENIAGFDASFQSATNTPIDAASFTIYDRGFIGVPDHAEGTFYYVASAPVTSLVDRVVFESSVPQSGGISTNDVCNIVTNEIARAAAAVADTATNYTDSAIASTDTSYPRVSGITNLNQTVQYVSIDSAVPTNLVIQLPTSGDTKDWIVYVTAQTNVTISLPAATWWLADTSATNDIAPQKPTALYFSQAADGIYTLGRQEFTEVVLP